VVTALDIFSVEVATMKRHAAMGTGITQREGMADTIASHNEWDLKQRCFVKLIAVDAVSGQSTVPEAGEHKRIGRLALGRVEFGHGEIVDG